MVIAADDKNGLRGKENGGVGKRGDREEKEEYEETLMERIIPKHNVHLQLWLCGKCSRLVVTWIEVSRKSFGKKICIKIKKKK